MTTTRPYLIRAIYDWIIDNKFTPYLVVNAEEKYVVVPRQYVQEGRIVLNISMAATKNIVIGNEFIEFDARFGGKSMHISFPVAAVMAIYARENNRGMFFNKEDTEGEVGAGEYIPAISDDEEPPPTAPSKPPRRTHLKIVK